MTSHGDLLANRRTGSEPSYHCARLSNWKAEWKGEEKGEIDIDLWSKFNQFSIRVNAFIKCDICMNLMDGYCISGKCVIILICFFFR